MSDKYTLKFSPRFWKDLDKVEKKTAQRILQAIESKLLVDPYRHGRKLSRTEGPGKWRIRIGDYRIRYDMVGEEVFLYRVRHRREIYR